QPFDYTSLPTDTRQFVDSIPAMRDQTRLPFPLHLLPATVQKVAGDGAEILHCPPEFIALPLLTFAGSTIGRRYSLAVTSTWREPPILFASVVGEPGGKKTPALRIASTPLNTLQAESFQEADKNWLESVNQDFNPPQGGSQTATAEELIDHFLTTDATIEK